MRSAIFLCAIGSLSVLVVVPILATGKGASENAPCLTHPHLPAFTPYELGSQFTGLQRTDVLRDCFVPPSDHVVGPGPRNITWTSTAIYGSCTPEGSEGGWVWPSTRDPEAGPSVTATSLHTSLPVI